MSGGPMNAERLLDVYEQISEAPDAIARLRRFVLDLAVRGKLVEQDAADEPASVLLSRLPELKEDLLGRTSLRRPKQLTATILDPEDDMPSGWVTVIGSDLFLTRSGNSKLIKGKQHSEPKPELFQGFSAAGQDVWLEHWEHEGSAIILSAVGARCGKAFLTNGRWSAIANTHIVWLMPEVILPNFAMLILNNEDFWVRSGGAQPFVKVKETLARPFLLPPLAEQHRIVAKVDELMALCDRLEEARKTREELRDKLTAASLARLTAPDTASEDYPTHAAFALEALPALTTRPEQIKILRQTILNLAVRGKLVEQDPTDEPAAISLERIAEARDADASRNSKRARGLPPTSDTKASELPIGWEGVRLSDIAVSMRYGTSIKCGADTSLVPVLRIPNVSSGEVTLDDMKFGPLNEREHADLALAAGDLLMIRSNGSLDIVGRSAVVPTEADGMAFAGYLVRLRTDLEHVNTKYVWMAMNSQLIRDQIEKPIRSAVGLKNVNLTEFGNLSFWLPPRAEQHRIVAKVEALMALCDRLEAALTEADTTRTRLLEALLHEALEPATDTLEAAE